MNRNELKLKSMEDEVVEKVGGRDGHAESLLGVVGARPTTGESVGRSGLVNGALVAGSYDPHRRASLASSGSGSVSDSPSGLESAGMPSFIPERDRVDVQAVIHAVAKGVFSGAEFALLVQRASLRCEVAARVSVCGAPAFDLTEVYTSAVEVAETAMGCSKFGFHQAVTRLALVSALVLSDGKAMTNLTVPSFLSKVLQCRMVGDHYAVATGAGDGLALGGVSQVEALPGGAALVPESVLRALLSVDVRYQSSRVCISLQRRFDGVFLIAPEYDSGTCYPVDSLPQGLCQLPGAFGLLTSTAVLSDFLMVTRGQPMLMATPGFCYLGCLPVSVRWQAACSLGHEVTASVLRAAFPFCQTWSDVDAGVEVSVVLPGLSLRHLHVTSPGNLPAWVLDSDVVAATRGGSHDEAVAYAGRKLDEILARVGSAPATTDVVSPPLSRRGSAAAVSAHDRSRESSPPPVRFVGGSVNPRAAYLASVSEVMSAPVEQFPKDPGWRDVDQPAVREWRLRLSEGAPVGYSVLMNLCTKDVRRPLPVLPLGDGASVFLPAGVGTIDPVGSLPTWSARACPIDGWMLESTKVKAPRPGQLSSITLVVPADGTLCRYEVSTRGSTMVANSIVLDVEHVVLWCSTSVTVGFSHPAALARVWTNSGVVSLGPAMLSLARSTMSPAFMCYDGQIRADHVVGLVLQRESPGTGMLQYGKEFVMKSPDSKVYMYLSDEAALEPAHVVVESEGLSHVGVYGIRVPALINRASFVAQSGRLTLTISLRNSGASPRVSVTVVCNRAPTSSLYLSQVPQGVRTLTY